MNTNKIDLIKAEVVKLKSSLIYGAYSSHVVMNTRCKEEAYNEVLAILDTLQEEPVSVWHNMDEVPIKGEVIVVQTKDTFYGLSVQKGGTTYKNKNKDRYVKWAYASDLLNLSNVQKTVKDCKEPVSEELEDAAITYNKKVNFVVIGNVPNEHFIAGVKWGKQQTITKACDWLKRNADSYTWYNEFEGESGVTEDFVDEFKKEIQ